MANRAQIPTSNSALIAMISDQVIITLKLRKSVHRSPLLLAFFISFYCIFHINLPVILLELALHRLNFYVSQTTLVGFLLAGVGNIDLRRKTNYLIVDSKTTVKQIEDAFKEFTAREDIAVVLISQYVSCLLHMLS
ncbi:hypothetical protein CRYUN_Cryun23aG0081400 [Craigia yunnanensis]